MSAQPRWLPELILLEQYEGDWTAYLAAVYAWFLRDFVESRPSFPGRRFGLKRYPLLDEKEATFWHITSEGGDETNRLPDLRRCERIRWPRPIIDRFQTEEVHVWRTQRRGEQRIVIALPDFSYIVVLADRGEYVLLWTAYPVEQAHRRRKLQQEHAAFTRYGKG